MKVSIEALRADVRAALLAQGVPEDETDAGVELCLDAELRGHSSHGVRLLGNVTTLYANGADRRGPLEVVHETPVSARVDGGFHLSWHVHRVAVDLLAEKALASGIGVVSVRRAGVSGAVGSLVERLADQGLVAIALTSTPLTVVAPGTAQAAIGTNPVAMAVPRADGPPIVLDMSTSAIAFNEVLRLRETGGELPEGVATDANGNLTTEPAAAVDPDSGRGRVLPFGGHRGYGLALMLELLVSAGVTGRAGEVKRGPVIAEPDDFAAVYLAYRPELVGESGEAAAAATALVSELEASGARVPGEESRRRREACLHAGEVEVDDAALELLATLRG